MAPIAHDLYCWLTKELLEKALKSSENNDRVQVIDYELHDAVGKGENYCSHMIRVLVNFNDQNGSSPKHKSFIVKTTLSSGGGDVLEKLETFKKEITFYRDFLPNTKKYLNAIDKNFTFTARCFEVSDNPSYFVFEDLKETGYRNLDRGAGLNFETTAMVLEKLGKYHAMSAMMCCEQTELCEVFKVKVINKDDTGIINIFLCGIKDCQELSLNWPGYEHLSRKLENFTQSFSDKVQTVFERDESEFLVVTHGDLWINNLMFKFDEDNNPIDVILVDFQLGYFGSPATDLAYLLFTSTSNDVKETEWDQLLEIYHKELVKSLKAVNYPKRIPTLTDIQIQLLKRSLLAVATAILLLGPRHFENSVPVDHELELFVFENAKMKKIRQDMYGRAEVKERIQYLLDYFERKGFLESY